MPERERGERELNLNKTDFHLCGNVLEGKDKCLSNNQINMVFYFCFRIQFERSLEPCSW